ncbi:META domain-containing protein [Caballeronia humi]|uniref:Lipoprotein n=1 Tax=Caballeronia humi TaxID=326474 RepID=A0A158HFP5_9BURK|nr:META domain-containing protein [Caballeronia humi]SAL43252.1 lipoprotein [Caballeronia humi]
MHTPASRFLSRTSSRSLSISRVAGALSALTLAALLGACTLPQHPDSAAPPTDPYNPAATQLLDDTQWELTSWADASAQPRTIPHGDNGEPITLNFSTEGGKRRVSGYSGCNRYMGTYDLKDGKLTFGPLAGTRMACMQGVGGALEQPYLTGLTHIARSGVQMNPPPQLQLSLDDGQVLTFTRRGK